MSHKIMVVDDEPANLRLLARLFRRDYTVLTAESGDEALRLLEQHDVALLITDQRMPVMTGIELLKHAAILRPHTVRIILTGYTDVGALVDAINCGQVYRYVTKPWSNDDLRVTIARALEHFEQTRQRHELSLANGRLAARLQEMTRGFVRAIADALDAKDEHAHGHARRTSGYAVAIGRRLGLDAEQLEQLSLAAFLHDIGKIGTPDRILLKPTALDTEERAVVELHSERGARILAGIPGMSEIAATVRHHHEHFDGSGYPEALYGEQIPLNARIILVADAYDALTSPRPFREAHNHDAALALIAAAAGTHFDPEIVRAFGELEALMLIRQSIAAGNYGIRLSPDIENLHENLSSLEGMMSVVNAEPVLAAKLLCEVHRLNDSVGSNGDPVVDLETAARLVGEERLRRIIRDVAVTPRESGANAESLWEHALRCANAARLLAAKTGIMKPCEAYTLGLVHDIGELLLRSLFPLEMREICSQPEDARLALEVEKFGVDYAQIGQWVMEQCGLPRELTAAVQTHHDVLRISSPVALLLHVADSIARADAQGSFNSFDNLDAFGSDRLVMLGLTRADVAGVYASTASIVEAQLTEYCLSQ